MRQVLATCLCIALPLALGQAFTRAGTTAAQFLKLPVSAHAAALSGSVAILPPGWSGRGNSAEAMLLNPAALAGIGQGAVSFGQQRIWQSLDHGTAAGCVPISDRLALGLGLNWLSAPDQEITTLEQPDGTGAHYSYNDLALTLSAGLRMNERLAFGMTARGIRQDLHNERAQGWGLDMALLLQTPWRGVRLACAIENFGTRMELEGEDLLIPSSDGRVAALQTEDFAQPLLFKLGLAAPLWEGEGQKLEGSLQAEHPNDNRQRLGLGLEYDFRERFQLRAGRVFRHDLLSWSAGAGLRHELSRSGLGVRIDAAWVQSELFEDLKLFTVGLEF